MAEFPSLGRHCAIASCNLLDFLPFKCYGCGKEFCVEHFKDPLHECGVRDVRVAVCPLCQKPVPGNPNDDPNMAVSNHLDRECKPDPTKKKTYANSCSVKGCRKKELVPFKCSECNFNFCVTHRHQADHECTKTGRESNTRRPAFDMEDLDRQLALELQRQEES